MRSLEYIRKSAARQIGVSSWEELSLIDRDKLSDLVAHRYATEVAKDVLTRAADDSLRIKLDMPVEKWQLLHKSILNTEIILP